MANLYLGLGSNLGDRKKNITYATMICGSIIGNIKTLSSLYETQPWGFSSDNSFLNAVIVIETQQDVDTCLKMVKSIEREMGRVKDSSVSGYQDRVIDIDILFYDDLVVDKPELKVPHPLIQKRDFVLRPLAEVDPDFVHPVLKKSMSQLLQDLLCLS